MGILKYHHRFLLLRDDHFINESCIATTLHTICITIKFFSTFFTDYDKQKHTTKCTHTHYMYIYIYIFIYNFCMLFL